MMKHVYLLQHTYLYGKHDEYEETKVLGIYDNEEKAQKAIKKYCVLSGFRDFSEECFSVDKYALNNGEWKEGFAE